MIIPRTLPLVVLLLLASCTCVSPEESLVGLGRILWPDAITVGRYSGDIAGIDGRTGDYDQEAWLVSATWDIGGAKQVRVIETVAPGMAAPREWFEAARREPEPEQVDVTLESQPDGSTKITIPRIAWGGLGTTLTGAVYLLLRKRFTPNLKPKDSETD
jgi:hypothetical protein